MLILKRSRDNKRKSEQGGRQKKKWRKNEKRLKESVNRPIKRVRSVNCKRSFNKSVSGKRIEKIRLRTSLEMVVNQL